MSRVKWDYTRGKRKYDNSADPLPKEEGTCTECRKCWSCTYKWPLDKQKAVTYIYLQSHADQEKNRAFWREIVKDLEKGPDSERGQKAFKNAYYLYMLFLGYEAEVVGKNAEGQLMVRMIKK